MAKCPKCDTEHEASIQECSSCGADLAGRETQPDKPAAPKPTAADALRIVGTALKNHWPMVLAGVLFLVMQWQFPLQDWWRNWVRKNSYYSHGPLVPLIAAFMVWANRKRIAAVRVRPSWLGLLIILASVPVFVFGRWTGSGVLCGITFITFLLGGLLLFTGVRMTWLLLFPVLYLVFMIPAPATVLDSATFKIQYQSTTVAAKILALSGYDVTQEGNNLIHSPDLPEPLNVGTPCSGFKIFISLVTFTAFFVYMLRTALWKKAVLVALVIPLSLFVNGLRIASIGFVGIWTQSPGAMHSFHDSWAAVMELVVCFAILFGIAKLIRAVDLGVPEPIDYGSLWAPVRWLLSLVTLRWVVQLYERLCPERPGPSLSAGAGYRGPATIALFCLIILLNFTIQPLEATAKGKLNRAALPASFGDWVSRDLPVDEVTRKELKTADLLQRMFVNTNDGRQILVFVEAAKDTDAFHDPHSCLPGGGSPITDDKRVDLTFGNPEPINVRATMLLASGQYGQNLVLYWYMNGLRSYPSTSEVRRQVRAIQLKDLYRLAANPGQRQEIRSEILNRQWYWYRFSTDVWEDAETDLELLKEFVAEFVSRAKGFGE